MSFVEIVVCFSEIKRRLNNIGLLMNEMIELSAWHGPYLAQSAFIGLLKSEIVIARIFRKTLGGNLVMNGIEVTVNVISVGLGDSDFVDIFPGGGRVKALGSVHI